MHRRFRADDPERKRWQDPEGILTSVGVKAGMVFMDIGCGEGYFTLPAARMVGPEGSVYAVDIDIDAIDQLIRTATAEGLLNIFPEVNEGEKAVLCEGCADFVFFGNNLHDFRDPVKVIENAKRMLCPTGMLIDLDWRDDPMELGPPAEKRLNSEKATGMIAAAGFHIRTVRNEGPFHYLIIATH
ncbi:MAG: class I SAM-dependent methyltransferase [Methanoregulaceae archaeon]|jgi:ubiquinone/menaquinone biosynthesis C-methylase UbiE|nr:class I SAM-dependent methyltransferase [Methanoregulaceae archaeon]